MIDANAVSLEGPDGEPVEVAVTSPFESAVEFAEFVEIVPARELSPNTTYTIRVADNMLGELSDSGVGDPVTWSFTTGSDHFVSRCRRWAELSLIGMVAVPLVFVALVYVLPADAERSSKATHLAKLLSEAGPFIVLVPALPLINVVVWIASFAGQRLEQSGRQTNR